MLAVLSGGGKKLLLIPIGQRYDVDEETNQTVDVVQKGQLAGIKVQKVSTLDEAYEALTGKTLPRVQAGSKMPDLSPDAYHRVRPKVLDSWNSVFKRAAEANLSYFDAIVLDQAAQAAGVRMDVARSRF